MTQSNSQLLTAAQMRALEQAAMDSGRVTGLELMERAGEGVVEALCAAWPDLASAPQNATVLCGPGNNGGDGFVVARLLKQRGWDVDVWLYGDPDALAGDAKDNYLRWSALGPVISHNINPPSVTHDALHVPEGCDVLIDALFGTGLKRHFTGLFTRLADPVLQSVMQGRGVRRVAVDLPTGLCSESGRVLGTGLPADLTVTFHSAKRGHVLDQGPALCGELKTVDIGLVPETDPEITTRVAAPTGRLKQTLMKTAGHKYDHGHALVLSGSFGKTGAARLAARAALRVGAGLVTLGVPGSAQMEVACHITSEMMTRVDGPEDLCTALADTRKSAVCLGPGLGLDRARDLVLSALHATRAQPNDEPGANRRGVVLDADALSAFAEAPEALFDALHETCVLTPHGGEFAKLFPNLAEQLSTPSDRGPCFSKVDATRAAARRAGCVVLFKGPDTVIAAPDGRSAVHAASGPRAAPGLATAGSGDVLAGLICGLLARHTSPFEAAQTAAWLHVEAARAFGPGLIAEDLPNMLPQVLRALGPGSHA